METLGPTLALDKICEDRDIDIITLVSFDSPKDFDEEADGHDAKANKDERGERSNNINKKTPDERLYAVGFYERTILLIFHQK
jgi:hypothetical protein